MAELGQFMMEAFHLQKVKFSDKMRPINIIDIINGGIYSCIVLHAMFYVVFFFAHWFYICVAKLLF